MRILVVEDEPLLAMLLEENLADLGHDKVTAVATVDQALSALDEGPVDAALLDFSLGSDTTSVPVALRLREEGTPFFYLSGHASFDPDSGAPEAPMLPKPVSLNALRDALSSLIEAN
jgi:DNA-binding response OmpR family regulator